jgi:hypothetical protein
MTPAEERSRFAKPLVDRVVGWVAVRRPVEQVGFGDLGGVQFASVSKELVEHPASVACRLRVGIPGTECREDVRELLVLSGEMP